MRSCGGDLVAVACGSGTWKRCLLVMRCYVPLIEMWARLAVLRSLCSGVSQRPLDSAILGCTMHGTGDLYDVWLCQDTHSLIILPGKLGVVVLF